MAVNNQMALKLYVNPRVEMYTHIQIHIHIMYVCIYIYVHIHMFFQRVAFGFFSRLVVSTGSFTAHFLWSRAEFV